MHIFAEQYRLTADQLRWHCDPALFSFDCTSEVPPLQEFVGQDRALRAIEFGLAVDKAGYNIFVTGLTGTGRASAIQRYLERTVADRTARGDGHPVLDWCYVFNFQDRDRPLCISLPRGRGQQLRQQVDQLARELKRAIERAFSGERYETARRQIIEETQQQQQMLTVGVEAEANRYGFALQFAPTEVSMVPLVRGQPASAAQLATLSEAERAALDQRRAELSKIIGEAMKRAQTLQREAMEKLAALDTRVGELAVQAPFEEAVNAFADVPAVLSFLDSLREYTLQNIDLFREPDGRGQASPLAAAWRIPNHQDQLLAYRVNLLVDNSRTQGPPIIIEHNPNFANMFGRIERRAVMGGYVTDHTMLKAGAVHLANGGYLVANARDVFANPGVWETMKRTIRGKLAYLEDLPEQFGVLAPHGLKPAPVALDLKIILVGDNGLYRIASLRDEDFWEMFKVKAEFDTQIDRTPENMQAYAAFISGICGSEGICAFDRQGVAAVLEHAARLVGNQDKLSTRFGQIRDLLIEADYWARLDEAEVVGGRHVRRAVAEKIDRVNLMQKRIRELITQEVLLIDVEGEAVGQVNGLAVYDLGDFAFGRPSRITARTFAGRGGVVNIERESQLSGKSHDKGVLILGGYLGSRYAQSQPLSLSATLCFEQSYEGVDGDSASSTELYAILSSLSGLPLQQSIAVTGSVNQHGVIQAIGGVNEKVEGFFDVCQAIGLNGEQGVIVPRANLRHLMLRPDVAAAVAEKQFHIFAVGTVEEGFSILSGVEMGRADEDGSYPEGTVNYLVSRRLRQLNEAMQAGEKDKEKDKDKTAGEAKPS